ncbi:hypothetical protein [Micromonospora ureilytica]|uniref:hypothetical protein n=1 Tax=Micromonospora ureilytica TaxID=709868 RepID=UPI002E14F797|nr:hypothetical protein OHB55_16770 [Micromonospora ureilytica]
MKLGEADLAWLAADRAMAAAGDPILAATAAVLRGPTSRWVTCGALPARWWTRTVSRRLRFGVGLWRVP